MHEETDAIATKTAGSSEEYLRKFGPQPGRIWGGDGGWGLTFFLLRDSTPEDPKGQPFGTFQEIHFG